MQPIPEVRQVAAQLAQVTEGPLTLLAELEAVSELVVQTLPSCVGVSITVFVDDEPITVTATSPATRDMDVVQYLDDGPCVEAARSGARLDVPDVLDERRWQLFARAAAAKGVRSSLSVPLHDPDGSARGALNLYSGDPEAFRETSELMLALFGQHVSGAVHNADLSFATREAARRLPQRLDDITTINQAVGLIVGQQGYLPEEARHRLESAARQAGVPVVTAASLVLRLGT